MAASGIKIITARRAKNVGSEFTELRNRLITSLKCLELYFKIIKIRMAIKWVPFG
jgi:hypothetical protein